MPTIIAYRGDCPQPFCDAFLDSGEHILISFNDAGAIIEQLPSIAAPRKLLFEGSTQLISWICANLCEGTPAKISALSIITSAALGQDSAQKVSSVFEAAAVRYSRKSRWKSADLIRFHLLLRRSLTAVWLRVRETLAPGRGRASRGSPHAEGIPIFRPDGSGLPRRPASGRPMGG
jgi:hypothetical protein